MTNVRNTILDELKKRVVQLTDPLMHTDRVSTRLLDLSKVGADPVVSLLLPSIKIKWLDGNKREVAAKLSLLMIVRVDPLKYEEQLDQLNDQYDKVHAVFETAEADAIGGHALSIECDLNGEVNFDGFWDRDTFYATAQSDWTIKYERTLATT